MQRVVSPQHEPGGRGEYDWDKHVQSPRHERPERRKKMRSDWWLLSLATGAKAHSTQKPEALLYRVILSSSNPGDVVLDPFFGSGTTGAVARNWIGIEREKKYIEVAQKRIDAIQPAAFDPAAFNVKSKAKTAPRVEFSVLVENAICSPAKSCFLPGTSPVLPSSSPIRACALRMGSRAVFTRPDAIP